MRIFIDTNIIISAALFPNSKVSTVLSYILETHEVIMSNYSIKESYLVFNDKFKDKVIALENFYSNISYALFVAPEKIDYKSYPFIRDLKDLPILASAILSDSDILLTGDKDFEDVSIKKPLIYRPAEYYELIMKNKS